MYSSFNQYWIGWLAAGKANSSSKVGRELPSMAVTAHMSQSSESECAGIAGTRGTSDEMIPGAWEMELWRGEAIVAPA